MNAAWLILLLPLAAASGWWFATRRSQGRDAAGMSFDQSCLIGINQVLAMEDDEALSAFLEAMDEQPKSVELQMVLGSLCRKKGEYERASLIHQAILNNQSHSRETREQAQYELAQDYQAAGWLDRSESLYVELLESSRFQRDTAINLIRIYHQEKDWESAVQMGNLLREQGYEAEEFAEQLTHFYCELCEQSIRAGRFPSAEAYLEEAEKIDPANPRVVILQGRMASFKGDHSAAIAAWKKLELIAPALLGLALPNIQDSYLVLQDEQGYKEFLKRASTATRSPEVLSALLDALKAENQQNAGQFLLQYLRDKPNIEGLRQILSGWKELPPQIEREDLLFLIETIAELVQREGRYQCSACGFRAESFEWSCPSCNRWGKYRRNILNLPAAPEITGLQDRHRIREEVKGSSIPS